MSGKKIGITRVGSSTHTSALYALEFRGIEADDYQILPLVEVPNILTALIGRPNRCRRDVAADQ